ncbi:unnamed protein product [Arabidopsis lyrata]|nr:unnamed protein product [Arabidopsis lyrata]
MEQPYLAPRRADLQCHLWDCHRCLLPYCMGIHKTVAVSSEADTRAAVIVDAPILPVHVLFIHPWQQGEVFDLAVGLNERERLPYIPEIIIQEPGTVEMPDNIPDPRPSNQPSPDSPTDSQPSGLSEVGDCSASESPFPVAGISITFMLNQMLDLDAGIPRRIVLDNLLRLLSVEESASDIRHCTAFKLIDQQWLSMRASVAFNRKYINLLYFAWDSKKSFQDLQWKQASDCSVSEYHNFIHGI